MVRMTSRNWPSPQVGHGLRRSAGPVGSRRAFKVVDLFCVEFVICVPMRFAGFQLMEVESTKVIFIGIVLHTGLSNNNKSATLRCNSTLQCGRCLGYFYQHNPRGQNVALPAFVLVDMQCICRVTQKVSHYQTIRKSEKNVWVHTSWSRNSDTREMLTFFAAIAEPE